MGWSLAQIKRLTRCPWILDRKLRRSGTQQSNMCFYLAATANSATRICVRNAVAAVALKASLVLANAQPQQDTYVDYGGKSQMAEWPVFLA